jgi:hypothetical protein
MRVEGNAMLEMTDAELIAARDKALAASNEKLAWPEFAKRTREWLAYRDECDRRGIPRRPH